MQQPSKNSYQIYVPNWINLGANLTSFWDGFGCQNGAKLAPNGSKKRYKKSKKNDHLLNRVKIEFWAIFGGFRGVWGGAWNALLEHLLVLEVVSWGQDGPQIPPRGLKD